MTAEPGAASASSPAPDPASDAAPAAAPPLRRLLKRRDFLAAARARRWAAESLVLQGRARAPGEDDPAVARVGFTCSKKVGGAVVRNRAKRRLRAAAAEVLARAARPGWDYVLIGREGATVARPFPLLLADLEAAVARVHAPGRARP